MARVALYHPWIYLRSGLERTLLELTTRSRHEWHIFTSHLDVAGTYPEFARHPPVELRRVPVDRGYAQVLRAAGTILRQRIDLRGFDALLVSCEGLGDLILHQNHQRPAFCLCFTPLRPVFDLEYRARHLQGVSRPRAAAFGILQRAFGVVDRRLWRRYCHVFCISEEVRQRVLRGGLATPERLEVVRPGVDLARWSPSQVHERFFLLPGRIKWTKNVELAIEAFREMGRRHSHDFSLVIAGAVDEGSRAYFATLQQRARDLPAVRFALDPDDATLIDLYRRCYAVLYPSFNEDWGLVPLEAMACGKPVVAVGRGGPVETVLDGVTGFLTPPTPEGFGAGMTALLAAPERVVAMGAAGWERAQGFGWDRFADAIDARIETTLAALEPGVGREDRRGGP